MGEQLSPLTVKDLTTDQEVRWCPGCGDYAILSQLKKTLASLGVPRERLVFVSGIGCSSRLPYYLNTYGFHTIAGRALTVATGLKLMRPELSVWVITGDGDGLSVGGNHLVHALRRNVDLKILLFNNETLGLTKGQCSPTSRQGTRTRSTPMGSLELPLRPLSLALASEASFVARTLDVDVEHLEEVLSRAARHRGSAFVEIYQNCKIYNDGVFEYATHPGFKQDHVIYLQQGQPLIFGKDQARGIRLNDMAAEIVELPRDSSSPHSDILVHDEQAADLTRSFLLSRMTYPDYPECFGVFRAIERPTFTQLMQSQHEQAVRTRGPGKLEKLFAGDDFWEVK